MNYYRSRILGTERQDGAVHEKSNDLYFYKGRRDSSQSCIWLPKIDKTNYNHCNINRNNSILYNQTQKHYDIGSDVCMMPQDEFSAFFEDFKLEANKTCISDKKKSVTGTILSLDPGESNISGGKLVSPMLDHEALVMLHANDSKSTQRQQCEPMDSESRHGDALNLLQKNDMMQTIHGKRQSQEEGKIPI